MALLSDPPAIITREYATSLYPECVCGHVRHRCDIKAEDAFRLEHLGEPFSIVHIPKGCLECECAQYEESIDTP